MTFHDGPGRHSQHHDGLSRDRQGAGNGGFRQPGSKRSRPNAPLSTSKFPRRADAYNETDSDGILEPSCTSWVSRLLQHSSMMRFAASDPGTLKCRTTNGEDRGVSCGRMRAPRGCDKVVHHPLASEIQDCLPKDCSDLTVVIYLRSSV